jgi:hypothetical protein
LSLLDALRKVTLRPLAQLLLLASLVVIAYVALGVSIVRQEWDQHALSSQVELGEGVLVAAADSQQDFDDLQARLEAAKQELAAAETAFPSELDSRDILETILRYVGESQVRLMRIDIQPPTTGGDEAGAYSVLASNLEVEGDFGELVAFVKALEERASGATKIGTFALQDVGGQQVLALELLSYARSPTAEPSSPKDESSTSEGTESTSGGEEAVSQ